MWSTLFVISIAQGIFFLALLLVGSRLQSTPARYLSILLILFLITNLDYFLVASDLYRSVPKIFGISNNLMMLMGPILYLYAKTLLHQERFRPANVFHFLPYVIFSFLNLPMFLASPEGKIKFIEQFIAGQTPLRPIDYFIFTLQLVHLAAYLVLTIRMIRNETEQTGWVRLLTYFLFGYGLIVLAAAAYTFGTGHYLVVENYSYSLACSFLLYGITGYSLLKPSIVFETKRRTRKPLDNLDASAYWEKVMILVEQEKIFVRPEIKLQEVAEMVGLSAHQLSQLINEKSGRNFSDFINHYRIEEFKSRVRDAESDQLTLVGLALEIGFNSKTSFNNTFKKVTGLTPSEYKRSL